jgi:hypothetical protein
VRALPFAFFVLFAACGVTKDTGTASDGSIPPFDAGAFCTGTSPKTMVNGADVPVMNASGKAIILNCCDSAELTLATAAYQALMYVMWRVPASTNGSVDLSNLPQGSSIEMDLGCDPATTSCASASPEERYTDGFSGTIQWQYGSSGMSVSYCLQVTESPSQPHSVIHSMALYAPNVASL